MELSNAHLRYLYTIYEISKTTPDVRSANIAARLRVSRPSVTRMLKVLMEKNLLVKELYGKIYLTDRGFLLAQDFERKVCFLKKRIPMMGLSLKEEEIFEAACALAAILLEKNPVAKQVEAQNDTPNERDALTVTIKTSEPYR